MRWPSRRRATHPLSEPIERIDPGTLEVVEIDAEGTLHRPPVDRTAAREPREIAYAPRDRDPTSLAAVWEALGTS